MYGIVTRNEPELDWEPFDRAFYEVKSPSGRHVDPVEGAVNAVSCHGDTATAEADPSLVPVDADGTPATRERRAFDWGYVCPAAEDYREGLRHVVETCADVSPDVRLDDVGFPRPEYCHCERCEAAFETSPHDDWWDWRESVVVDFLRDVREAVPGDLSLAVHPDPYPDHLRRRSGAGLDALEPLVDEVIVPLYDTAYETTYWLEAIASGFADALDGRLAVELYAVDVDVDALVTATAVAETYADAVYFGYDASNARAAIRRKRADEREGRSYP
ncbi:MAG: hypothetical protein ABEJ70_07705 [Halobacteriaceae archaeon]